MPELRRLDRSWRPGGNRFGRRRIFKAGLLVFTVGSRAGGLAAGPALLVTAHLVQGVGAAMGQLKGHGRLTKQPAMAR
jgi:MFS family permease